MRRLIVASSVLAIGVLTAGPAAADHVHTLHNPARSVTFKCEAAAAAGQHPIHNGLHVGIRDKAPNPDRSA